MPSLKCHRCGSVKESWRPKERKVGKKFCWGRSGCSCRLGDVSKWGKCPTNINILYDAYVIMIVCVYIYIRRSFVHSFSLCPSTVAHIEWPQYFFLWKKDETNRKPFHFVRFVIFRNRGTSTFHFVGFGSWLYCFLVVSSSLKGPFWIPINEKIEKKIEIGKRLWEN